MAKPTGTSNCAKFITVCWAIVADPAAAQSLPDAMVEAYLNSPRLAAARANVKVYSERAVQARSKGRLSVNGKLSFEQLVQSHDRQGLLFPGSAALNASLPLYTGGQVQNSTAAAETRVTASEAQQTGTEQQVLLDAVTAFMDVRRDEEFVILGQNSVRVYTEELRSARERFDVGEVTRTDVEQARAFLAASQSALAAAKGSLESSREAYQLAVGKYPGKLKPPPPIPELPPSQDQAVAMAMRDEPALVAARLERSATGSDVRTAIGALLPQVSLDATVSTEKTFNASPHLPRTDTAAVGVTVNIPLWAGGYNYSNIREAEAVAESASASITSAMRSAARNVGVAWATLQVAQASIRTNKVAVSAAKLAFEGVQEEAKVGARTTLDVLNAEQSLLKARADLVAARHDEYVAAYTLLASVGKLTVKHLGLDTGKTAERASYYETVRDRNFGYSKTDDTVWRTRWRP